MGGARRGGAHIIILISMAEYFDSRSFRLVAGALSVGLGLGLVLGTTWGRRRLSSVSVPLQRARIAPEEVR